jgi:hypothetical protein
MIDPVEAFKRARQGVFRNAPENDPFQGEPLTDEELERREAIMVKRE